MSILRDLSLLSHDALGVTFPYTRISAATGALAGWQPGATASGRRCALCGYHRVCVRRGGHVVWVSRLESTGQCCRLSSLQQEKRQKQAKPSVIHAGCHLAYAEVMESTLQNAHVDKAEAQQCVYQAARVCNHQHN